MAQCLNVSNLVCSRPQCGADSTASWHHALRVFVAAAAALLGPQVDEALVGILCPFAGFRGHGGGREALSQQRGHRLRLGRLLSRPQSRSRRQSRKRLGSGISSFASDERVFFFFFPVPWTDSRFSLSSLTLLFSLPSFYTVFKSN